MLKMTIDNEEVVSDKDITINEEMLSASSTILNNVYPKEWEEDKDYTSRFYYPQDYSKALIQRSYVTQEAEAGTTIQVNGSVTLNDVDTTKNSRVLRLLGQTSQAGTPTPSSPIPVNVVSGDNEINVVGKNLYNDNFNDYTRPVNYFIFPIALMQGQQYTIKATLKGTSMTGVVAAIVPYGNQYVDFSTTLKMAVDSQGYVHTITFTPDDTWTSPKLAIYASDEAAFNSLFKNYEIQLEKGSSASTYEAYTGNTYNVDLPVENLCDVILDSSISGDMSYKTYTFKPNTQYTISTNTWVTSSSTANIFVSAGTSFSPSSATNGVNGSRTITSDSNGKITIGYRNVNNSLDYSSGNYYIQIEKGTKANSYTPYGTIPIELCKIGNYQDYIYKDSDKWYKYSAIGKVVLDGSEQWSRSVRSNGYQFDTGNSGQKNGTNNIQELYSNYFKGIAFNYRDTINESIYSGNNDNRIRILTNVSTQSVDFQTWLSTNKPTVYYILETPTNTEITYEPLIEQLNALSSQ